VVRRLKSKVIGIDAPEPGDCGGGEATASMRQLALARTVTLVSDPALEQFESPGNRPLFYVDRDDGLDVGLEMLRAGWADIWELSDFRRSPAGPRRAVSDDARLPACVRGPDVRGRTNAI
jgi:endonuclease YncB( thermonuclease family)